MGIRTVFDLKDWIFDAAGQKGASDDVRMLCCPCYYNWSFFFFSVTGLDHQPQPTVLSSRLLMTRPYHSILAPPSLRVRQPGRSLGRSSSLQRGRRPSQASERKRHRVRSPMRPVCLAAPAFRGAVTSHLGWRHACDRGCRRRH